MTHLISAAGRVAGNSIFFYVKRIEDPIGLLPAKLILGINKRGVHFFRPVPSSLPIPVCLLDAPAECCKGASHGLCA
jgi:hypothetical protein